MITNHAALRKARNAWGGSLADFDLAASVLDVANCRSDVHRGLTNPPYTLANPQGGGVWHIIVRGVTMVKYELTEDLSAGTADVEIVF